MQTHGAGGEQRIEQRADGQGSGAFGAQGGGVGANQAARGDAPGQHRSRSAADAGPVTGDKDAGDRAAAEVIRYRIPAALGGAPAMGTAEGAGDLGGGDDAIVEQH